MTMLKFWQGLLGKGIWAKVATAAAWIIAAYIVARLVRSLISRRSRDPRTGLLRGVLFYSILVAGGILALQSVGFDPSSLLVTGGLLTVAVGFASQTSLSNLISGVFLAADEPFRVGDYVRIGDVEGTVLSLDLLSTKLRTLKNDFIRLPNETLVKGVIVNLSRYPIRRIDIQIHFPLDLPLESGLEALYAAAAECSFLLVEPEPMALVVGLGEYSAKVELRVWVSFAHMIDARDQLHRALNKVLHARGLRLGAGTTRLRESEPSTPLP